MDKLRSKALYPNQLLKVDWNLNVQLSQDTLTKMRLPTAIFDLMISTNTDPRHQVMEFTRPELQALYEKLETIQSQLDQLA